MQLDAQRQAAAEEKKSEAEEKKEEAEENKEDKSFDENQVKQSPDFKIPAAQQKFAEDNEKEMEAFSKQGDEQMKQAEELGDKTVALYNIPVWYGPIALLMSLIAMAIAACYLFTSIWLLMTKPSAVPLFSLACVVSIGFAILHGVVSMIAMPMWGMGMGMTGIVVAVVNVVLLIVVATGDKTAFQS